MSYLINEEFAQALNPLYAFPIVAVILCAFIVYAFGFKSPVQPPSFERIEEQVKKVSKKRKTKESSKVKGSQDGKLNGSATNKGQSLSSPKKNKTPSPRKITSKEEKSAAAEKPVSEKSNEKKGSKKAKVSSEKKLIHEKRASFSEKDTGEDGWVQLVSKKGRRNQKKDEAVATENQAFTEKQVKNLQTAKSEVNEIIASEEATKDEVVGKSGKPELVENSTSAKKPILKDGTNDTNRSIDGKKDKTSLLENKDKTTLNEDEDKPVIGENKDKPIPNENKKDKPILNEKKNKKSAKENKKDKTVLDENKKDNPAVIENKKEKPAVNENKKDKAALNENKKDKAVISENKKEKAVTNESKKDKPILIEDVQIDNINLQKAPVKEKGEKHGKEVSNKSKKKKSSGANDAPNLFELHAEEVTSAPPAQQNTSDIVEIPASKVEDNQSKESKASNVVFDELAGLYPEAKEQRKKKKVRRDH